MHAEQTQLDTLALDIGLKRVGFAIGSSVTKSVKTLTTESRGQKKAEQMVLEQIKHHNIQTLVVGLPLDQDGSETTGSASVRTFVARIRRRSDVKIVFVDEWGSSLEAKRRLNIAGETSKDVRKSGVIDALSASIILETFFGQS